ncbi:MAG: tetratricopeptide repeat protein [Nitrospinae bacterium]|nr:tetratricopeptide repeat protein [Nitrospinota bacterium]
MIFKRHIFAVISRVCHCEAKPKQSLFPFKNIMGRVWVIIIALFLFFPSPLFAETKEIISEGTYNMGDGETPSVAEGRALVQAKRTALEQAGTYVESYTKVENLQLTKDEIQVLASGIMEVEILNKKRTVVGDGIHFWVKIKAKVNPDKIEEMAKRVKEKSVVEDYKKIQEAYDKNQKEIEELKKQLAGAKGEKKKKQVEAKITDEERLFEASQWFDKGYQHALNKEYDNAIESYTKAIALDPNYAQAYNNRGVAYYDKGQHDRAIEDYNKAIALDPNLASAYNNRGVAYGLSGNMGRAISDFQKACDMGNEKGCKGLQMVLEKR